MDSNQPTNNQANNQPGPKSTADLLARAAKESGAETNSAQTYFPQATPQAGSGPNNNTVVSAEPTTMNEANNLPKPKKSKKWLIIILIFILILLVSAGAGYYFIYYQPKAVLAKYFNKITSSQSGKISASIKSLSAAQDQNIDGAAISDYTQLVKDTNVTLAGMYDFSDKSNPKADITIGLTMGGAVITQNIKTQLNVILVDKTLYFKVDELGLLQILNLTVNKDWYKLNLEQSLSQTKCYLAADNNSGNFLGLKAFSNLSVKNAKRDHIREQVDGKSTSHYTGEIDFSKLNQSVEETNKQLPADCKISLNAANFADTKVNYDLWMGNNFDRLKLTIVDTKNSQRYEVVVDSSDYNESSNITIPQDSKNIEELLSGLYSSGTGL